ncbi:MAG: D-tyrosyl-tRNA(Tyr) deacylase [Elusimicrobia bacterium]|nr:D-tyrosyl-tRNA(Tyr) deacylase [Elusimicrobiota bacterium]
MIALLQRVSRARVLVEGQVVGEIGRGVLVFLAVERGDGAAKAAALASKVRALRMFPSEKGRMDLNVDQVGGAILVVSQFTLAASCREGNRPSFDPAAPPEEAERLYEDFVAQIKKGPAPVGTGKFRAMMEVDLVNDGPVTFLLQA